MRKFNFGIIGAGNISHKFCDAVKLVDNAKVIAISSNTPNKAETFANENGIPEFYNSYEEMLCNPEIDAVYIATTHNFHYENIKLCIKHKKPVICEKCFVLTKAEAVEIFALAKENNVFVMEAMWTRFLPVINKALEWIESGKLGRVALATCIIGFKAEEGEQSRMYNPKLAGGAMYDIGVYAIEIMTYLINQRLKDVSSVITYHPEYGVDTVDAITLTFDNCVATLNCIITAGVQSELNIYGTNARIIIKNPHCCDECSLIDENGVVETFYSRLDNGFEYQINELINCVAQDKLESSIIPHKDTVLCAEIFDKCLGTK